MLLNADGTLNVITISDLSGLINNGTAKRMIQAGEVSALTNSIDQTQNVASTSAINIVVSATVEGIARIFNILINL